MEDQNASEAQVLNRHSERGSQRGPSRYGLFRNSSQLAVAETPATGNQPNTQLQSIGLNPPQQIEKPQRTRMPPENDQGVPDRFYLGFELIEHEDTALPSSTASTIPVAPNNTYATGQMPNNNAVLSGQFNLFSCLPFNIPFPTWRSPPQQLTSRHADMNDNYEIPLECIDVNFKENYIGGGNQSSVFKGKWNGKYIALKKLNRASEVDIQKLVSLKHKNIVQTLGICSKDMYPCIVMELCEKGALFELIQKQHIGKHKFLGWAKQISSGMSYLHNDWKIIHRDLKSPNILVDSNDCLKICDFGSLYTWDKTYMQSAVMSVCGTSQWMSPEMLRNEPCNEKVDVWSFAVILWELLIQEIPYKNVQSMAIMFGVGSGNLSLHLPRTLPDTCKLLMKICFAKKPRNRPSFASILGHLSNLEVEINSINEDQWRMRKEAWKREVNEESEKFRQRSLNGNDIQQLNQEQTKELEQKRMHELRHAEEIREMYMLKMERAERMLENLTKCMQEYAFRERALTEWEEQLGARAGTVAPCKTYYSPPPNKPRSSFSVPEVTSIKVEKAMIARTNNKGQKTTTDVYNRAGQRAVLTMEVDDDENDVGNNNLKMGSFDTEEELYESDAEEAERLANRSDPNMCHASDLPNIPCTLSPPMQERLVDGGSIVSTPKRQVSQCLSISSSDDERFVPAPRSRHSYSTSHQNSFEETNSKFSSRGTSARSSVNFAQRQLAADFRANRNSISHLPPYEHTEDSQQQFVCPCCAYEFRRNCSARISGISADSGVASTMDERQMSALTLESTVHDDCICMGQKCQGCQDTSLYRNEQARWSDGRIYRHHHRSNGHTPLGRQQHKPTMRRPAGSFTRNSPARRVASASNTKRHRTGFERNSTGCLESAFANDQHQMPCSSSSTACHSHSVHNSQSKLATKPDDEDVDMPQQDEQGSGLFLNYHPPLCHQAIIEMDSSTSTKGNKSPKKSALMEQSTSSTMASSLERSLESALADGLSDKEAKLKAVKSTFRTHRRCASNPTNIEKKSISRILESSESDNEPVNC